MQSDTWIEKAGFRSETKLGFLKPVEKEPVQSSNRIHASRRKSKKEPFRSQLFDGANPIHASRRKGRLVRRRDAWI